MIKSRAKMPCLTAFCETRALPSGLTGPVETSAFRLFASICYFVVMNKSPFKMVLAPVRLNSHFHSLGRLGHYLSVLLALYTLFHLDDFQNSFGRELMECVPNVPEYPFE